MKISGFGDMQRECQSVFWKNPESGWCLPLLRGCTALPIFLLWSWLVQRIGVFSLKGLPLGWGRGCWGTDPVKVGLCVDCVGVSQTRLTWGMCSTNPFWMLGPFPTMTVMTWCCRLTHGRCFCPFSMWRGLFSVTTKQFGTRVGLIHSCPNDALKEVELHYQKAGLSFVLIAWAVHVLNTLYGWLMVIIVVLLLLLLWITVWPVVFISIWIWWQLETHTSYHRQVLLKVVQSSPWTVCYWPCWGKYWQLRVSFWKIL